MLWFSKRDGLKSYATSGTFQRDVFSMFFTQDAWDEFNLSKEDYELKEAIKKLTEEAKDKEDGIHITVVIPKEPQDKSGINQKKGMIIDTRFNGGGKIVADLAMFYGRTIYKL